MGVVAVGVIGDGAHGQDIVANLSRRERRKLRWYVHHENYSPLYGEPAPVIGINDPHVRAHVASELDVYDPAWVHPDAHLYHDVHVAWGTHINYGVHAVRTRIGVHTTIGPCVAIAGDVTIGDRVFIGIGANIGNLVTIGDDAIIGAGSVVLKDVAPGQKVLGVWA